MKKFIIKTKITLIHIPPQPLYSLIVYTFAGDHAASIWSSSSNHVFSNVFVLKSFIGSYSKRQTITLNSTFKACEKSSRFIIVSAIQKCNKPAEAINTINNYEIPSDQFVVGIYMPKVINTFDIVYSSLQSSLQSAFYIIPICSM